MLVIVTDVEETVCSVMILSCKTGLWKFKLTYLYPENHKEFGVVSTLCS